MPHKNLFEYYQPSPGDPVYKDGQKIGEIKYANSDSGIIAIEVLPLGPRPVNAYAQKDFQKQGYTLEP